MDDDPERLKREVVQAMRRFLRARWEDRDETIFLDRKPAPARREIPDDAAPVPVRPAARPPAAPRPAARLPVFARPAGRPASAPAARSAAMPAEAKRHPSGIIAPDATPKGKELLAHWNAIHDCTRCPLAKTRRKFVYGMGRADTEVVFVGEAPGEQEDAQGLPFVGAAGHLLDRILAGMGMHRDSFFICNVLKCRPPGNRNPQPEEMDECEPHLNEQLRIIAPRYVVALGAFGAQSVLRTQKKIGELRGRWHRLPSFEVLAVYHPAAALRATAHRKTLEGDLALLKARLGKGPGKTKG